MVQKDHKKKISTGPGLFEALEDANTIPYSPGQEWEDWSLSKEEETMFEGMGNEQEIADAKEVYLKVRGPNMVNSMGSMRDGIKEMWFDRVPISDRKLTLHTTEGGLKLFNEWVKDKFK